MRCLGATLTAGDTWYIHYVCQTFLLPDPVGLRSLLSSAAVVDRSRVLGIK